VEGLITGDTATACAFACAFIATALTNKVMTNVSAAGMKVFSNRFTLNQTRNEPNRLQKISRRFTQMNADLIRVYPRKSAANYLLCLASL